MSTDDRTEDQKLAAWILAQATGSKYVLCRVCRTKWATDFTEAELEDHPTNPISMVAIFRHCNRIVARRVVERSEVARYRRLKPWA